MSRRNEPQNENKLELAQKIADQSKKAAKAYESMEDGFFRVIRFFSNLIDKFMFDPKYGAVVSLFLAVTLYATINFSDLGSLFKSQSENAWINPNTPIVVNYNSDKWEIEGIPELCEVIFTGDQTSLTTQQNSTGFRVVADLTNLTAGTHTVRLTAEKYISGLKVTINPTNVHVTIKEKITQNMDISYDFINQDKMDSIYALGTPEFEMTKVAVRASENTLNSVAFVKALIDVSGVTKDFTQAAKLVAYNQNGEIVDVAIVPETVNATVRVSSPNKQVPVVVEPQGEIPNGMAIDSIAMDHSSVTVFAPESVLNKIDKVTVTFDASQLDGDSSLYKGINLPASVKQLSVTKINMDIKLAEAVTRIIEGVPLNYRNYTQGKKAQPNISTVDVQVIGTQTNVDKITVDDIYAFIDLQNVTVGENEVPIQITPKNESLVKFAPMTANVLVDVIDEGDSGEDSGSSSDNN